jgi:hypothetical protein
VTFLRLNRGDVIAAVAALGLLLFMAMDWYSTPAGESFRDTEELFDPDSAPQSAREGFRVEQEDARLAAEAEERNVWQVVFSGGANGVIDAVILVLLVATAVTALMAAAFRAAERPYRPPRTPSALAAVLAAVTGLLVVYRMIQEPGLDQASVVKLGAPLGLLALGLILYGALEAVRIEADETETDEHEPASAVATDGAGQPGAREPARSR